MRSVDLWVRFLIQQRSLCNGKSFTPNWVGFFKGRHINFLNEPPNAIDVLWRVLGWVLEEDQLSDAVALYCISLHRRCPPHTHYHCSRRHRRRCCSHHSHHHLCLLVAITALYKLLSSSSSSSSLISSDRRRRYHTRWSSIIFCRGLIFGIVTVHDASALQSSLGRCGSHVTRVTRKCLQSKSHRFYKAVEWHL